MRGDEHRKPRRERTVRAAEAAAERLARDEVRGAESAAAWKVVFDHVEQGTRQYFAMRHPNSSTLIGLLDRVRLIYRAVKEERGIDDENWEDPHYGQAGRRPASAAEMNELEAFNNGSGPRPFWCPAEPE